MYECRGQVYVGGVSCIYNDSYLYTESNKYSEWFRYVDLLKIVERLSVLWIGLESSLVIYCSSLRLLITLK